MDVEFAPESTDAHVDMVELSEIDDILSEIISYCDPKFILKLDLTCKKFLKGHCWALLKRIDIVYLYETIYCPPTKTSRVRHAASVEPAVQRILYNCAGVRRCSFGDVAKKSFGQSLADLEEILAPQVTEAVFDRRCSPDFVDYMLSKLNSDLIEGLTVLPRIDSRADRLGLNRFARLKFLQLFVHWTCIIESLEQISAGCRHLEHLSVLATPAWQFPARDHSNEFEEVFQALSKAAGANRRTLKSLSFLEGPNRDAAVDAVNRKYPCVHGDWTELAERISADFVVPLSDLKFAGHSWWEINATPKGLRDLGQLSPLFELCHPSPRSACATRALLNVATQLTKEQKSACVIYILDTVCSWLSPSWSWTQSQFTILKDIAVVVDMILTHIKQSPQLQAQAQPFFNRITETLKEIIGFWPDAIVAFNQVSVWSMILDSDLEWVKTAEIDYSKLLRECPAELVAEYRLFELALQREGRLACSIPSILMPHLNRFVFEGRQNRQVKCYLLRFRDFPQYLPLMLEQKKLLKLWIRYSNILAHFLSAMVVDEAMIYETMTAYARRIGNSAPRFRDFFLSSVNGLGLNEQPLLSEEEKQLVMYYFWKAHLEAVGTDDVAMALLDKFGDSFPTFMLPDRIRQWAIQPGAGKSTIRTKPSVNGLAVKRVIRRKWRGQF